MAKKQDIAVTPGSGNVFGDIGVAEPEEELAKAQLANRIRERTIRKMVERFASGEVLPLVTRRRRIA
jgi:hypothetical protein